MEWFLHGTARRLEEGPLKLELPIMFGAVTETIWAHWKHPGQRMVPDRGVTDVEVDVAVLHTCPQCVMSMDVRGAFH